MTAWATDAGAARLGLRRACKTATLRAIAESRAIPPHWLDAAHGIARLAAARWPCGPECRGLDHDDLVAEALAAAWEKLLTFDPAKGVAITTWLVVGCRSAIQEALRKADILSRKERAAYREAMTRHLTDPEYYPEPESPRVIESVEELLADLRIESDGSYKLRRLPVEWMPVLGQPDPAIESAPDRIDRERIVKTALAVLTERERALVLARINGATLDGIAAMLGLSDTRTHQIWHDAIRRMRAAVGVEVEPNARKAQQGA